MTETLCDVLDVMGVKLITTLKLNNLLVSNKTVQRRYAF